MRDLPPQGGKARIAYSSHLPEGPPRRPHRLRRRDHRRRRQLRRSPRGAGHVGRHLGGRADLTEFLRKLTRRGLRGVKLVVSDAHEGLEAAVTKVLNATWQRCRVGLLKNQSSAELCGATDKPIPKTFFA